MLAQEAPGPARWNHGPLLVDVSRARVHRNAGWCVINFVSPRGSPSIPSAAGASGQFVSWQFKGTASHVGSHYRHIAGSGSLRERTSNGRRNPHAAARARGTTDGPNFAASKEQKRPAPQPPGQQQMTERQQQIPGRCSSERNAARKEGRGGSDGEDRDRAVGGPHGNGFDHQSSAHRGSTPYTPGLPAAAGGGGGNRRAFNRAAPASSHGGGAPGSGDRIERSAGAGADRADGGRGGFHGRRGRDTGGADNDDGVDARRQRMIREAIEGARRTEGPLAGEAIVRTPYKPDGSGGKVAGKVTFMVSPVEVAREVMDQAAREALDLTRRTIHPAIVQAQGRRFQSLDMLGLGSGSGLRGAWEGEGEGEEEAGGQEEGTEAAAGAAGGRGSGGGEGGGGSKFLHDFRDGEKAVAAAARAGPVWRPQAAAPDYRFIVVGHNRAAPPPEEESGTPPPPSPQQSQQKQGVPPPSPWAQRRQAPAAHAGQQGGQQLTGPSRRQHGQQQRQEQQQQGQKSEQQQQPRAWQGLPLGRNEEDEAELEDQAGTEEESGSGAAGRRQRYDYRLRLDPAKSVGGMAGALLQAISRHLVVLSELVGPDELYYAVKVVATARAFIPQQQQQQRQSGGGGGSSVNGRERQQKTRQQVQQSTAAPASREDEQDLALQVLMPKQPYIRPRGYGKRSGSSGWDDEGDGDGTRAGRVWRLYSHRVPAPSGRNGAVQVEPPVRLYVSRTSDVQELAGKLGPAVVRDGQVALLAAGRDAVVVALAAVVRTRSWLASGSGASGPEAGAAAGVGMGTGEAGGRGPRARALPHADGPTASPLVPLPLPGEDLDVAVYPSWRGPEGAGGEGRGGAVTGGVLRSGDARGAAAAAGAGPGPTAGADGAGGGDSGLRTLQLLVRLCRGSRPDLPVLGADELLPPAA